jgi:hypothetical protein
VTADDSTPMEIRRSGRLVSASVIAPLVPVLVFAGLNRGIGGRFVLVAMVVSYLHSAVGISLCLWLRRVGKLSVATVAMVAALLGSMPVTFLTCSIDLPDFESVGDVVIVQHGRLTTAGYWEIVRQALSAGGLGISAGIVWFRICSFRPRTT